MKDQIETSETPVSNNDETTDQENDNQECGHAIREDSAAAFTNVRQKDERKSALWQTDLNQLEFDFVAAFEAELTNPSATHPF